MSLSYWKIDTAHNLQASTRAALRLIVAYGALAAVAPPGAADVHYVATAANAVYPYTTEETAARSFQQAIEAAEPGDTVLVLPGMYHRGFAENVTMRQGVNFSGSGPDQTVFCPDISMAAGIVVSGFRFLQGKVSSGSNASVIADCVFEGAAIECGGWGDAVLSVIRCEFVGRRSGRYVDVWGVPLSIHACRFRATQPTYWVTAIAAGDGGFLRVDNCVFTGCDTAISLVDTDSRISRTIFADNGVGLDTGYLDVQVSECTFFRNQWAATSATSDRRQEFTNCIVWASQAGNVLEEQKGYPEDVYAPEITFSDVQGGYPGRGNIDADPMFFLPSADEPDLHLCAFSPCVDAGDPFSDYSREPQPNGGRINMGAYGGTWEATTSELVDMDGDNLRDDWEMEHFGALDRDGMGDADGDGLSDRDEYRYLANPNNPDTDGDDLLDRQEAFELGSNPTVADTDNDGTPDGKEVEQGTDPLDPWDALSIVGLRIEDDQIHVTHPVQPRCWYELQSSFLPGGPFGIVCPNWEGRFGVPTHTFVGDISPFARFYRIEARPY